jgi:hypothetical protein
MARQVPQDKGIKALSPKDKPYIASDGQELRLLISPDNRKAWEFIYESPTQNKRHKTTLGTLIITAAANVGARYVESDFNDNTKGSYTSLYASYKFDGALKNFKLSAEFESKGKDKDGDQLRFKANYKF